MRIEKMEHSEETKNAVWKKGKEAPPNNPEVYRKDECGAWITRSEYGNRNSPYGWEIDHIFPGGSHDISNLRPLQWENNVGKSDGKLKGDIVADGIKNVRRG